MQVASLAQVGNCGRDDEVRHERGMPAAERLLFLYV